METIVKITWDDSQIKNWWLTEESIKLALNTHFENKTFEVDELIEVDEDEYNDGNEVNIKQVEIDLANKEQQLSDLLKFVEINDGYQFGYLEHEIDVLKMEIENLKAYFFELSDDGCECPFCKIDELEVENEGLCDENINLCLQLKEKDSEIEKLKKQIETNNETLNMLKNSIDMCESLFINSQFLKILRLAKI